MRSLLLLLALGCVPASPVESADRSPGTCALGEDDGSEKCPIDACAIGCASVEEGLECCRATHGNGEPGAITVERTAYCATEQTYDPGDYLGEDAARCAAQVYGLTGGLDECYATLVVCDGGERAEWYVQSVQSEGCGWSTSEGMVVDAVDARVEVGYTENADGICEE